LIQSRVEEALFSLLHFHIIQYKVFMLSITRCQAVLAFPVGAVKVELR